MQLGFETPERTLRSGEQHLYSLTFPLHLREPVGISLAAGVFLWYRMITTLEDINTSISLAIDT